LVDKTEQKQQVDISPIHFPGPLLLADSLFVLDGHAVAHLVEASWKVAGMIPDKVIGFSNVPNPFHGPGSVSASNRNEYQKASCR
jgi:hypothetical protein